MLLHSLLRPLGGNEYVGLHQLIWRLPNLLCHRTLATTLRHILGGLNTSLPTLLHRDLHRPPHRCWIFPPRLPRRFISRRIWPLYDFSFHILLAAISCTGRMLWTWEWVFVLPEFKFVEYVLFKEAESGDWHLCGGEWDWRDGFSSYGTAIAPPRGFRMDDEVAGVHTVGLFDCL